MNQRRPLAVCVTCLCVAVFIAACGVPVDPAVRSIDSVPFGLMRTSTSTTSTSTTSSTTSTIPVVPTQVLPSLPPTTAPDPSNETVQLYFVNGDRFVEERRTVAVDAPLFDIVFELVRGPVNPVVGSAFLISVVNFGDVIDVTLEGGLATVELGDGFTSLPAGEQRRLIGQLVLTLGSQRGVGQVRFTVSGNPLDVPQGDGTFGSDALSRDSFQFLVDAITEPQGDPVVSSPGAGAGSATTTLTPNVSPTTRTPNLNSTIVSQASTTR